MGQPTWWQNYTSREAHQLNPYLKDPEYEDEHEDDLDEENEELSDHLRDDDLCHADPGHPGPVHQPLLPLLDQHHCRQSYRYPQSCATGQTQSAYK